MTRVYRSHLGFGMYICVAAAGLLFSGCGSGSSVDSLRSHVNTLQTAIQHFNADPGGSLSAIAAACSVGARRLRVDGTAHAFASASRRDAEIRALEKAAHYAEAGFSHCAAGERRLDYPLMVRASAEIAQANYWIHQAHRATR